MKKVLKKLFIAFLSIDFIGNLVKKLSRFTWKIKFQRELIERKRKEELTDAFVQDLFKDKTVKSGPFKGLKYPKFESRNSSLYSKLLGSYEKELHEVFNKVIQHGYDQILDIGCAEGYYAVGLALKIPQAKIFAYDVEPRARQLTYEMSKLNGVESRINIHSFCDATTLRNFTFEKKSLIISDCEGYEKLLFTQDNIENLVHTDLIIETHDFLDIHISSDLEKLFSKTHDIKVIQSIGDVIKAKTYVYPELATANLETRYRIFEEGRRFVDEWLIITSKQSTHN